MAEPQGTHEAAVALGRLGGKKGGRARAETLTPAARRAIALNAARARWGHPARVPVPLSRVTLSAGALEWLVRATEAWLARMKDEYGQRDRRPPIERAVREARAVLRLP